MNNTICQPSSPEVEEQKRKMENLAKKWANNYEHISNRYEGQYNSIDRAIKIMAEEWLQIPYEENYPLSDFQWRKLDAISEDYNTRLRNNWSASIVPEGTSMKDPVGRKFHLTMTDAHIFERDQIGTNHQFTVETSTYLRQAYIDEGFKTGLFGIKTVNDIRRWQNEILKTDDEGIKNEYQDKIADIINSEDGKILRDFRHLNSLSDKDFNQVRRYQNYLDPTSDREIRVDVNKNTILAAENARKHLKHMGNEVATSGLDRMLQLINTKYDFIGGDKESSSYKNLVKSLNEAKDRIKNNDGGYMPTMFMESLVDLKVNFEDFRANTDKHAVNEHLDVMTDVLTSINKERLPNQLRARNEHLNNAYNEDPIYVIDQYGKEVIAFNKLAVLENGLLVAMKDLPSKKTEFTKGLARWIQEQHYVATKGLSDRPDSFNEINKYLSAAQTISTMALNPTGAIKNTTSLVYYLAEKGRSDLSRARKLLKYDDDVRKALDIIEKEQGFLFPDASVEMFAEGLITTDEGISKSDIVYDPETGKITVKGQGLFDYGNTMNWTIDKLLIAHKITENKVREYLFKTSFALKYKQLKDNPHYMRENDGDFVFEEAKARKFAKNHANKTINLHAYDYAIYAKAPALRGMMHKVDEMGNKSIYADNKFIAGLKGVAQQQGMSLMHYPMSLVQTHIRKLQGLSVEARAAKMKDLTRGFKDLNEMHFFLRYAAAFGLVQFASVALNLNFNNIIDFDMVNRIGDINNNLTSDDDDEELLFGLISSFTGAGASKANFALQMAGVIDVGDSEMQRILFGNVDYQDPDMERLKYYQYSTFAGNVANKYWPSFQNGDGFGQFRHLFKSYPEDWTKKYNKKMLNKLGVKKAKKAPRYASLTPEQRLRKQALKSLESLYRS